MAESGASELTAPAALSRTNSNKSRSSKKLPGSIAVIHSTLKCILFTAEKLALERETKRTEFTSIGL